MDVCFLDTAAGKMLQTFFKNFSVSGRCGGPDNKNYAIPASAYEPISISFNQYSITRASANQHISI
jgi:hypothetical protein